MILLGSIIFVIIFMAFVMSNNDGAEMNTVTSPAEIKNHGVSREYIVSQLLMSGFPRWILLQEKLEHMEGNHQRIFPYIMRCT